MVYIQTKVGKWHHVSIFIRLEYCNAFTFSLCHSEGSLHSSDSVSDSSPPPAVVQTGVPTQVVQQVQTAQQVKYALIHKNKMKLKLQMALKLTYFCIK